MSIAFIHLPTELDAQWFNRLPEEVDLDPFSDGNEASVHYFYEAAASYVHWRFIVERRGGTYEEFSRHILHDIIQGYGVQELMDPYYILPYWEEHYQFVKASLYALIHQVGSVGALDPAIDETNLMFRGYIVHIR